MQQQPVAIAAQPQPVAQLVAAQATVATTALATTASYAYAEVPYEAPMTAEEALATAEREGLIMCRAGARTPHAHPAPDRDPRPRVSPPPSPAPSSPRTLRVRPRAESKTGFRGVTHVTGKKASRKECMECLEKLDDYVEQLSCGVGTRNTLIAGTPMSLRK